MLDISSWDERRDFIVPGNTEETIQFAASHFIHSAQRAIQHRGFFAVALSGGSTPKKIYQTICQQPGIEWDKVFLFWSDERGVPPDHEENNYQMAMESGFKHVPIPQSQIFRMVAEDQIEKNASNYEEKIQSILGKKLFDLIMLGIGEDGHIASLFPASAALKEKEHLVTSLYLPEKKNWRMTLTFPCIETSAHTAIYALGSSKQKIVVDVLNAPIDSIYPASRIGTSQHKALWVMDQEAAKSFLKNTHY